MVLKSRFLQRPDLLFRLVKLVDQILGEISEPGFVEAFGECLPNESNGGVPVSENNEMLGENASRGL